MSQTQPRVWEVHAEQFMSEHGFNEGAFRDAVARSLAELEVIGHNLGGGFVVRPIRQQDTDGAWYTVGWRFNWQSFVPAPRPEPAPAAAVEPPVAEDPEPEPLPHSSVDVEEDENDEAPLAEDLLVKEPGAA